MLHCPQTLSNSQIHDQVYKLIHNLFLAGLENTNNINNTINKTIITPNSKKHNNPP